MFKCHSNFIITISYGTNACPKLVFTYLTLLRPLSLSIPKWNNLSRYEFKVHCIILGYINLRKVKWDAKHEYDFVHNFKVLQATFKLLAVDKV